MNDHTSKDSRVFAAELINSVKDDANNLTALPDGTLRSLSFEQAAAVAQVKALNAIAASLVVVADAIGNAGGGS